MYIINSININLIIYQELQARSTFKLVVYDIEIDNYTLIHKYCFGFSHCTDVLE